MLQKQIDIVSAFIVKGIDEYLVSEINRQKSIYGTPQGEYEHGSIDCAYLLLHQIPKIVCESTDKINFSPVDMAEDGDEVLIICLYEETLNELSKYCGTAVYDCQDEYQALIELLGILTEAQNSKVRKEYFFGYIERESIFHGMGQLRHFANDCYDILEEHISDYGL